MNSETQTVNILDCIKWLTDDFTLDREEMQYNRLIDDLMDELRVISESDATIDLLDKETWGEHDFTRAYDLIWNAIAPRAAHQQRVENLVQTAGFLGKTKVEEVRRSARAKIHCIFYRDFKTWSLAILRKKTDRENKERMQQLTQNLQTQQQPIHLQMKQTPQKVDGAIRLEMMSEWMDLQYEAIEAARKSLGTERMKSIIRDINDPKDKSSAEDNAAKLSKYKRAIKSTKNRLVDSKHLCDVPRGWRDPSF